MRSEPGAPAPCRESGEWSNPETRTVYEVLEWDRDHLSDILDRISYDTGDEDLLGAAIETLAFLIEDDLRADIRYHYIVGSMWEGIVMSVIENADFKEIAEVYLKQRTEE